jgi:hypothetical protein
MVTAGLACAQPSPAETKTMGTFEGRPIVVSTPASDNMGFHPLGRTTLCVEGPPRRQCYQSPEGYGFQPQVKLIVLGKGQPAIFFTVVSGGVSQSEVHLALLRPGRDADLANWFFSDPSVTNFGQYEFWTLPALSAAPILLTAEYELGPSQSSLSPHRYIISACVLRGSDTFPQGRYHLEDRFMTRRLYDRLGGNQDILAAEKAEILARLKKVAAEVKGLLPPSLQD